MTEKFGLSQADMTTIVSVIGGFRQVKKAIIFGSRAMGNFKKGSDVDIALTGENIDQLAPKIKGLLDDETLMPYIFDVVDYASITNTKLTTHIDTYGKVIYSNKQ